MRHTKQRIFEVELPQWPADCDEVGCGLNERAKCAITEWVRVYAFAERAARLD